MNQSLAPLQSKREAPVSAFKPVITQVIVQDFDSAGRFISDEEFKMILDWPEWSPYSKFRLMVALMGTCGMRCAEAVEIPVEAFSEDFSSVTHRLYKPIRKKREYADKIILTRTYKQILKPLPQWLQEDIKMYNRLHQGDNWNGRFFGRTSKISMFRYFVKIRKWYSKPQSNCQKCARTGLPCQGHPEWLDVIATQNYESGRKQNLYRIASHGLKGLYVTTAYDLSGDDLKMAQKCAGHSRSKDTDRYVKRSKDSVKKLRQEICDKGFDLSFTPEIHKDQVRLTEY